MSDNIERFVLEDGRKAEKVVVENKVDGQESQRVIEIKAEEVRPLRTQQRITEKMRSYMYERVTETINQETGAVVETKVETFDCISGEVKDTLNLEGTKNRLKSLGAVEELEGSKEERSFSLKDIILTVVIAAQVLGLAYLLFFSK